MEQKHQINHSEKPNSIFQIWLKKTKMSATLTNMGFANSNQHVEKSIIWKYVQTKAVK